MAATRSRYPDDISFGELRIANVERCRNGFGHPLNSWSMSDWGVAAAGEMGEACDVIKKLNRCRDGLQLNDKSEEHYRAELAHEIADTILYLDLLAASEGISLGDAIRTKFNLTSEKHGVDDRL